MVGMKSEVGYQYMPQQHLFDRLLVKAVPGIALSLIFHMPFAQFLKYFMILWFWKRLKHFYRLILIVTRNDQIKLHHSFPYT